MMIRLLRLSLPLAALLGLAACSPSSPAPAPQGASAPDSSALGTPAWQSWVGSSLGIQAADEGGPAPGSAAWNQAVQDRLGQEAPQQPVGSPQWQQAVDALLRTRGDSR